MKLPSPAARLHRQGFTLIEILTVVAIIAILAALTATGINSAQVRAHTSDTQTRIKFIDDCLSRYQKDNGEYPKPASPDNTGNFFNKSWITGGAACVYQAITGDGTDQISGFVARSGEQSGGSTGEIGSSNTQIYIKEMSGSTKTWFTKADNGSWVILDGFRLPFQYKPRDLKKSSKDNDLHNETYDLWSYGNLKEPSDASDNDKARQWITNWQG